LRAAELFGTACDIQGVQGLAERRDAGGNRFGHSHEVDGAGRGVDDGRVRDSNFRCYLGTVDVQSGSVTRSNNRDTRCGVKKTGMPIGNPGGVRVKGIGTVVFGDNINHIVGAPADADIRHIKGLCVNLAVYRVGEKFPEGSAVDIGRGQGGFALVPTVAGLVVMVGG
jgi:hypothetical protein